MRTLLNSLLILSIFNLVGQTKSVAKFTNISIDSMGDLKWTTTYFQDLNGLEVAIEKKTGTKWTYVDGYVSYTMPVKGKSWSPSIRTKVDSVRLKFHKGTNVYRLVMKRPEQITSSEITLVSNNSNDDGSIWIVNNNIILDDNVQYEILNSTGSTIKKGEEKTINISDLTKGSYFLYTKSWTKEFKK